MAKKKSVFGQNWTIENDGRKLKVTHSGRGIYDIELLNADGKVKVSEKGVEFYIVRGYAKENGFDWEKLEEQIINTPLKKMKSGGAVEKPKPVSYTEDEKRKGLYTVLFSDGEKQVVDFTLPDLAELRKQSEIFAFADKNYKANRNEFKGGGEVDKQYSVEVHFNPADANYFIEVLENILGVKITDASMFDVQDSMITVYGLTKKEEENLFSQLSADSKVLNCDSQEMMAGGGKVDKQVERVAPEQLATGGEIKGDEDCWCFPLLYY